MFNINCQISLNLKLDKLNSIYYNGIYPGHATSCKEKSLLIIIIGLVLNFIQYMKNTPHPNPGNCGSQKLNSINSLLKLPLRNKGLLMSCSF